METIVRQNAEERQRQEKMQVKEMELQKKLDEVEILRRIPREVGREEKKQEVKIIEVKIKEDTSRKEAEERLEMQLEEFRARQRLQDEKLKL